MSIDYATDIQTLYASNVVTDAEYLAVPAVNRNQVNEQQILTHIELTRALMATFRSDAEARIWHQCLSRMMAAMSNSGGTYTADQTLSVTGTTANPHTTIADGDTVLITNGQGSETVTIANSPHASVAALVIEINSQISTVDRVEAFADGNFLGFRNATGDEGTTFTLAHGSGTAANSVLAESGIDEQTLTSSIETIANVARDDALSMYQRPGRAAVTP